MSAGNEIRPESWSAHQKPAHSEDRRGRIDPNPDRSAAVFCARVPTDTSTCCPQSGRVESFITRNSAREKHEVKIEIFGVFVWLCQRRTKCNLSQYQIIKFDVDQSDDRRKMAMSKGELIRDEINRNPLPELHGL